MAIFARVTRSEIRPDNVDDAEVKYEQETVFRALKKINGFKGAYVLVDRTTGRRLTMTLWESETAMQASEDAVAKFRGGAQAVGITIVGVDRYEVAVVA